MTSLILVILGLVKAISQRERNWLIEQFQNFARFHRIRVTFLSGDVHCAAVGVLKTLKVKNKPEISPLTDYRYMVNIVTSKFWCLNYLRFTFDFPSFPRCHCEYTTVRRSILFSTFWVFFNIRLIRPNGVITMVSSLATKVHRTLHSIETDETMVRFPFS